MTHIGIMIEGQNGLNWDNWKQVLQTAEETGYQCVFRSDHFTNASGDDIDSLELWTSLTYAASHTQKIEFGPLVTPVTFRHPSMTIRYAAAVDDLSGGRLVLGMGAGWQEREHTKFGVPFYDFPKRFAMLTEALDMTRLLFDSDEAVHYEGTHFSLKDAVLLPRPQRKGGPPILIGGNGPKRTLPLVAKYASEWNAVYLDHATYKDRTGQLNDLLDKQGRQPSDVKRSLMTQVIYDKDQSAIEKRLSERDSSIAAMRERGLMVGTAPMIIDQLGAWADLGVERFMLQWLDLENIDKMGELGQAINPHFH